MSNDFQPNINQGQGQPNLTTPPTRISYVNFAFLARFFVAQQNPAQENQVRVERIVANEAPNEEVNPFAINLMADFEAEAEDDNLNNDGNNNPNSRRSSFASQ